VFFGPAWKAKQMTVSEYVKSWIREHQQTSNRSAVEEKHTKVSGEEGIREDQPYSVNVMSVICSQTTVSGEGGIREDRAHTAKGKRTMVRDYVEAGRLENQPPCDDNLLQSYRYANASICTVWYHEENMNECPNNDQ